MTVEQCYQSFQGDYEGVTARISKPALLIKLLNMFPKDPSMKELDSAISEQNAELAFRAVHTLKGVAMNMGFSRLAEASSELTELLRARKLEGYEDAFHRVSDEYEKVLSAISQLET